MMYLICELALPGQKPHKVLLSIRLLLHRGQQVVKHQRAEIAQLLQKQRRLRGQLQPKFTKERE